MKKILKATLILFVFCLTLSLSGFFVDKTYAEDASPKTTINDAGEFEGYIKDFSSSNAQDHIILTADIDMKDIILNKSIGTQDAPFAGIFDGQGHKITNLTIVVSKDMSVEGATADNFQYGGLFGVTQGAIIKNLSIEGSQKIKVGGYVSAYVGGVVAYASNTTFESVKANSNLVCEGIDEGDVEIGNLAGCAVSNSDIKYVISNASSGFERMKFELSKNQNASIGGLVGRLSSSKIKFSVVEAKFNIEISNAFDGELNVGGIVGKIEQSSSEIVNIACENTFDVTNNSTSAVVNLGQIAGAIKNPAPISGNIANIKFAGDTVNRFGTMGNYVYTDADLYDMILTATGLNNLDKNDGTLPSYFANSSDWHKRYGNWDFENVWYVDSREICLQAFYKNFNFTFEPNNVVECITKLKDSNYNYQEEVSLIFAFKNGLNKYYTLTTLSVLNKYNNVSTTDLYVDSVDGTESYKILNSDYFSIQSITVVDDGTSVDGIELKIKKVNLSSAGQLSFITQEKLFNMKVTSRLYDDKDNFVSDDPGYVYFSGSLVTTSNEINYSELVYGTNYRIETRVNPSNTANSFVGWYLLTKDVSSGNEVLTEIALANPILEIKFGQDDNFLSDVEIVAKYQKDACLVAFLLDEGISKIEISSGAVVIDESTTEGNEIPVSKTESSLKLEIFVKKGFLFDVDFFIETNFYKAGDSDINIITQEGVKETEEGGKSYLFSLDMTKITGDYADSFTIKTTTLLNKNQNKDWIWWTIGGVAGGVLLIGIIILIVVLSRRNRFGGGSTHFSKKNFKNMYY